MYFRSVQRKWRRNGARGCLQVSKNCGRVAAPKVLSAAERMYQSWKPSYLFVATPSGFFFGAAKQIVAESGTINKLEQKKTEREAPFLPEEWMPLVVMLL